MFVSLNIFAQDINFQFVDKGMKPIMNLANDQPVVSYVLENGAAGSVKLAVYDTSSSSFNIEELAMLNLYGPAFFDVFDNKPFLSFHDHALNGGGLNILNEDQLNWSSMDASNDGHDGWDCDIKVLGLDRMFVSYIDAIPFNGLGLEFSSYNGVDWKVDTVGTTTMDYGYGTSLEIDSNEDPHIFYYNSTSTSLEYAYKLNNIWIIDTIDSTGNVGFYPISVLKNDTPIVAYLKSINTTEAEIRLATKSTLGDWVVNVIDTLSDFNFALMGKQPIDIDLKDDLFIVCSSTKQVKEFIVDVDFMIMKETLIWDITDQDSTFSQTVSFENDSVGFKHFTVGLIINAEENIYYGTDKKTPNNVVGVRDVINVYPNPFTDHVIINGVQGGVFVYNSMGVEVFKTDLDLSNKINLSFIAPGVYYLKYNNSYASVVKR